MKLANEACLMKIVERTVVMFITDSKTILQTLKIHVLIESCLLWTCW